MLESLRALRMITARWLQRIAGAAGAWLQRAYCGAMSGHNQTLHFEGRRVSLRCHCGYESSGWYTGRPPRRRYDGDPARHRITIKQGER